MPSNLSYHLEDGIVPFQRFSGERVEEIYQAVKTDTGTRVYVGKCVFAENNSPSALSMPTLWPQWPDPNGVSYL